MFAPPVAVDWLSRLLLDIDAKAETQAEKDKKKEEQKRRLSLKNLRAEPSVESQNIFFLKPGHWLHARQEAKANQGDESLDVSIEITDRRLDPIHCEGPARFWNSIAKYRSQKDKANHPR